MKLVILAGGLGTRISEETDSIPKPMVLIGTKPILWHIMKTYSFYGINDFIIACGYKGYLLKEYFSNYYTHNSDIKVNLKNNKVTIKKFS
jgi:glucose-1-phosphate cytidylyltransferase